MGDESRVTFCDACGEEAAWGNRFCSACGAPMGSDVVPIAPSIVRQAPPVEGIRRPKPPRRRRRGAAQRPTSGLLGGLFHGVGAGLGCLGVGLAALVVIAVSVSGAFKSAGDGSSDSHAPRLTGARSAESNEPEREEVFAIGDSVTVDYLVLTAHSPRRGRVPLKDDWAGKPQVSADDLLSVDLSVKNTSSTQLLTYQPLGAEVISFRRKASLTDDFGNVYKRIHFGIGTEVKGAAKKLTIYPGKSVDDVLVFELPIKRAQTLTLTVPLHALGIEREIRFQFPVSAVRDRR